MTPRTLVAGIGNVFFRDDGFGVEVASRLMREPMPPGVRIVDTGIRARHLAFELIDGGYDAAILVDTVARGGAPGTLYLIEPEPGDALPAWPARLADGHGMTPRDVIALLEGSGKTPARVRIVGCEPESIDEGVGLSPAVDAAVGEAVLLLKELLSPCA